MADPPFGLTYVAPALDLPPWLSYTSSPTATVLAAYTVATLAANGAPTLITGAIEITRYETVLLQLAITVDSAADVRGQDLGDLYTTAGGTEVETVVNEYGGTRRFTLGASETTAGAAPTSATATAAPSRTAPRGSTAGPSASQSASATPASSTSSIAPPTSSPSPSSAPAASATVSTPTALSSTLAPDALSSASRAQASLSSALASAASASSPDPQAVASLSSALASASSAAAALSSRSALSSVDTSATAQPSSSSPSSITSSSSIGGSSSTSRSSPSSAADTAASRSGSLTGSQLAAAIAAPICFFFLVLALLALCCCCLRRRRRRRANRRLAEEDGLLGARGGGGGVRGGHDGSPSGIMWEWVSHRRPSEPSGRTSRASVRSVLSRATGGLLGGAAGRSTRSSSTPGSSPRDARERGFLASSGGTAAPGEAPGLVPRQYGPAGEVDLADGVGPSTPLLGVESPRSSSPEPRSRSPRVHYIDFDALPAGGAAFHDVDLASPRPDTGADAVENSPGAPPREMQETSTRPLALPILPPIPATNGALRLSTLYDPPVITQLPPSPSSYEPPLHGAPRRLDVSNGHSDDSSSRSEGHKRDTRLGYLSWTHSGGESDNERAVSGYGPELTPPQTPEDEGLGLRVAGEDEDSLEGGPMLSTQPSAMRRSFSSELSETGVPDSALFLNDPRWTGVRRPSPPPFSSFEPTATSSISYDPPIFIHRHTPHDVDAGLRPHPQSRHSATSGTTDSLSRYDDGSSLAPSAFPLDSPLVYPSPRFSLPHSASAAASLAASRTRTVGRERSVESGLSLERIAASFGSVKDGLASGLGFDFGEGGGGTRRSVGRNREFSTESMTDPFQHSYSSFQRRLPSLPSPANTPPRHPLHSRSSQSLRRPRSQPSLIFQSIPEASPEHGAANARQYVDPYEDGEESLLDADEYGEGYGEPYGGSAKRWVAGSSRTSIEP